MLLKISTTENIIAYEGKVQELNLPTEQGQIKLNAPGLPNLIKLIPGLLSITLHDGSEKTLSISKGIALINGEQITLTTSTLTTTPLKKLTELRSSQYLIELKLQKLKQQGSIEDITNLILELEKVKADIQLAESIT